MGKHFDTASEKMLWLLLLVPVGIFGCGVAVGAPMATSLVLGWLRRDPLVDQALKNEAVTKANANAAWAGFDAMLPRLGLGLLVGLAFLFLVFALVRFLNRPHRTEDGQLVMHNVFTGSIVVVDPNRATGPVTVLEGRTVHHGSSPDRELQAAALLGAGDRSNQRSFHRALAAGKPTVRVDGTGRMPTIVGPDPALPPPTVTSAVPERLTYSEFPTTGEPYVLVLGVPAGGLNDQGQVVRDERINLRNPSTAHVLIGGTSGGGKTNLLKVLVHQLGDDPDLEMSIIDPDSVLAGFRGSKNVVDFADEPDEWTRVLEYVVSLIDARRQDMKPEGHEKWDDMPPAWRRQNPLQVVVIDELRVVTQDTYTLELLITIVTRGRKFGINLVAATQYPNPDVVPRQFLTNCPVRICFKVPQRYESESILGTKGAEALPTVTGRVLCTTRSPAVELQTPLFDYQLPRGGSNQPRVGRGGGGNTVVGPVSYTPPQQPQQQRSVPPDNRPRFSATQKQILQVLGREEPLGRSELRNRLAGREAQSEYQDALARLIEEGCVEEERQGNRRLVRRTTTGAGAGV